MGFGEGCSLTCDLIHISHEWELGLKGSVCPSGSFPYVHVELSFYSMGPDSED
jgi:hypothetical protein